jgi:hypothetical protein
MLVQVQDSRETWWLGHDLASCGVDE